MCTSSTTILQDGNRARVPLTSDDNMYNIVDDPCLMVNGLIFKIV